MADKKFGKPLNPDNFPNLPIIIIEESARFRTTTQVLDLLENIQKESLLKKVHQSGDELREIIRTVNPHNAKFNRAK